MLEVKPFSFRERRFRELLRRGLASETTRERDAAEIVRRVAAEGADALLACVQEFNSPAITRDSLRVPAEEIAAARQSVSEHFLTALSLARVNNRKFHEYQRRQGYMHDDGDGVSLSRRVRPIARAGICCGASFSALLTCAVPALVAGVGEIALATAPRPDGDVDPRILATAGILGIDEIYRMDGPHAVAAFAYGAGPVPRVDKIVGPGGAMVAEAKRLVAGHVGVDNGLGVSELAVIADDSANARFIAGDLLAQAEHDDGRGVIALFTPDRMIAEAVRIEVERLADQLPDPARLRGILERCGAIYVCDDLLQAVAAVNALAPARLSLVTRHNEECLAEIEFAGTVYLGPWTGEAAGHCFAGLNPLLPVAGAARFGSGLGVDDFVREISVLEYSPERLLTAGRHLMLLADEDGSPAHREALRERLDLLKLTVE